MYSGAIQVELFFESSSPLWNRRWNLPHTLKSQLYFGITHLRGPGGNWLTWDQEVQGKSACPVGFATKSPNFPNTRAQAETEQPKGISSPDAPSHPISEERSLWGVVALGCILKYMTEKKKFCYQEVPERRPMEIYFIIGLQPLTGLYRRLDM